MHKELNVSHIPQPPKLVNIPLSSQDKNKKKKKNVNSVNSPSNNESRWLLDDTHPYLS